MEEKRNENSQQSDMITIKALWFQCLNKWPWFVISVVFCLTIAAIHLWRTPKQYSLDATIMIKPTTNRNASSFTNQLQNMGDMNLFGTVSDVQNEILCIQSTDLMLEVVKRMHLDYTYSLNKHLRNKALLYGSSLPVEVEVKGLRSEQGLSMTLNIENNEIFISNLKTSIDGVDINDKGKYACVPESTVQTPIGDIIVHLKQKELTDQTIYITRQGMHSAVSQLSSKMSFTLTNKQASLIDISCKDYLRGRAEDIINTLVTVYNESWVRDKNLLAIATSDFINDRISVIESDLGDVDKSISSFKSKNNLIDFGISSSQDVTQTISSENSIRQHTNELYMVRYIRNYMTQNDRKLLPTGLGLTNNSLNSQIEAYNAQVLKRDNVLRYSSESSPIVIEINSELAALHAAVLSGLDNEKMRLEQLIQAEQRNQDKYTERISNTPQLERDLRTIGRQQEVKEQLYLYLLQKREENELTQAFTAYNTRIVATPYGGLGPVSPQTNRTLMLAFLMGLFLPLAAIYLKATLNTTVRGRKDLENLTTPFVGEIPKYSVKQKSKEAKDELVVKANNRTIINEAFRVVRSNLELMLDKGQKKVVMVTSFNPGSGKSFISTNLAASMAIKGKRVAVVDLDLRHASVSNHVNRPKQGVSNYLAGTIDNCPNIEHPAQKNLFFIPVGTIPPNPTELLYSDRLKTLIEKLKADYDLVILDCPPVEMLADASIIAQYANKTLFVVRAGLLERDMVSTIDRYYNEHKLPEMIVLLNGTEKSSGLYSYHYGYYHHYGDYYRES